MRVVVRRTLILLVLVSACGAAEDKPGSMQSSLTADEAKILVYLFPVAHKVRSQGFDVACELQPGGKDRYRFWVYNSKRKGQQGSVTIGYYSVGALSGDVRDDDLDQPITSTEIEGVRRIILRSHHNPESTKD